MSESSIVSRVLPNTRLRSFWPAEEAIWGIAIRQLLQDQPAWLHKILIRPELPHLLDIQAARESMCSEISRASPIELRIPRARLLFSRFQLRYAISGTITCAANLAR